jgi:hypothetical protein
MARAKDVLAARLTRRGVPLSLLAPLAFTVEPSFAAATTHAAIAFVTKNDPRVPATVLILAKQELKMSLAKKVLSVSVVTVAVLTCWAFGLRLSAEPPPPAPLTARLAAPDKAPVPKPPTAFVGKAFAIAPVTTDLQRRMFSGRGGGNATVVVLLDGAPLFKDAKTLDVEAFDLSQLLKALETFPLVKGKTVAQLTVHFPSKASPIPPSDALNIVCFVLEGAPRWVGFVPTNVTIMNHPDQFTFGEFIGPLKGDKGAGDAEDGVGDERARAYPVRTPLSKILTDSADGVVDVRVPLDGQGDDWLPAEVDKSVRAAIGKLKLAKGQRINFLLPIPKRGDRERVRERARAACKRWAEDSGLEMWSFTQ